MRFPMNLCTLAALVVCAFTSCTRLSEFPVNGPFDGIETALCRGSSTSVFIAHGVGGYSVGDPDTLIKTIEIQLCLEKCGEECTREIIDEETDKSYGYLTSQEYVVRCTNNKVRIYSLDWRNATWNEKSRLRYYDGKCFVGNKRLAFVDEMKQADINNSVADTLLYTTSYRGEIQYPFSQSIRWIQEDAKDDGQHENIFVGYSLAGIICLDTLLDMKHDERSATTPDQDSCSVVAECFTRETAAFFMVANTYPIIELLELKTPEQYQYDDEKNCKDTDYCPEAAPPPQGVDCNSLQWDWEASSIGQFVYEKRKQDPCFQIISISDPNDFISFSANGYPVPSGDGELNAFMNQDVRNATTAVFGMIDPRDAHRKYGQNAKVLGMIIYGCQPRCR